ncbi:uncharacterized protein LOC119489294 [Sebastes umbrosus]|uniref:uncharacterized protein LOC119489294 n=1 Tax=Sebastes umbrosus TaxID=72105 RepID=UPI00189CFD49|nr:uncharacterized protein LOC119489294 [Sebastes umbrosus]
MSMSVHDEDPWLDDGALEPPQQQSEAEEAIGKKSPVPIRWSSRLTNRNSNPAPSISEWPVSRLLEILFKNRITAPVGSSHEELFQMFLESVHGTNPPADLPKSCAPKKAAEKRKHSSQHSAAVPATAAEPPSKRARAPAVRAQVRAPVRATVRAPVRAPTVLRYTFKKLGIPLSEEKTSGPLKALEFLGITLDSNLMQASLPPEKLNRIREVMREVQQVAAFSKRELLSFLGHLNFAMRVIPQGRSFISRLLDLSKTVKNLHDMVSLDAGCRSELRFWSLLCKEWNGISFFYNEILETSLAIKLYTDAAPSVGFGVFFNNQWFADAWPKEMSSLPANVSSTALMEMYPIVIACLLWGKNWSRKQIMFFCDNEATVNIINKGRSSVPFINRFVRRLTWSSVMGNFIIRAAHIPGLDNKIADSLSRFEFQKFRQLCPEAAPSSLNCPPFSQTVLD